MLPDYFKAYEAQLRAFRDHLAKQLTKLAQEIEPDVEIVWKELEG